MSDTAKSTDGDKGTEGATPPAGAGTPPPERSFTQAELDAIVTDRINRERGKYSDYDSIKERAAKADELEAAGKTELEKATARADKAEATAKDAQAKADATLRKAAIMTEATAQGAVDPGMVADLLAGSTTVVVKDGEVIGAKDAVAGLLTEKKFLKSGTLPNSQGAEFSGNDKPSIDDDIAKAEKDGDWKTARRLKIEKSRT